MRNAEGRAPGSMGDPGMDGLARGPILMLAQDFWKYTVCRDGLTDLDRLPGVSNDVLEVRSFGCKLAAT